MDIRHLTHIVALADQRNFARAAEQVHLSQPALSRSIQAAEAELELRLFDRGSLEVTPTPAGEFVLERARRLVFDSQCLRRDVGLYRDRRLGNTGFGVGPYPAATVLAPLLISLRQHFPQVQLRTTVGNWELLLGQLKAEQLEFFLADTRDIPRSQELDIRQVVQQAAGHFVHAQHPLLQRGPLTLPNMLSALRQYGLVSVRVPASARKNIELLMELHSAETFPIALECDDVSTLKQVALATDSILLAPQASVAQEMRSGQLVALDTPDYPTLYSDMGIVMLRGRTPSPMAQEVIQEITALLQT
jgi:DNA-binding transcriptional LysR family regulator